MNSYQREQIDNIKLANNAATFIQKEEEGLYHIHPSPFIL